MPIMPTWTWRWKCARPGRWTVKIAVPLAYGLALISSIASSSVVHAHDGEHRAEDLVAVDVHLGRDAVEQRRADEEAVALDLELAAVDDDVGALRLAAVDVADDPLARLRGDDRAHVGVGLEPGADLDRLAPSP